MTELRKKALIVLSNLLFFKFIPKNSKQKFTFTAERLGEILAGISYRYVPQKKKDGSVRDCYEPNEDLKELQQAILRSILHYIPVHESLCGFVPEIAMKNGVNKHLRGSRISNWIVKVDIKDFFPSVKSNVLNDMFEDILTKPLCNYELSDPDVFFELCNVLVKFTTYKGKLTQGAPTSPYLANLVISWAGVADELDYYCKLRETHRLLLSIYADDITISSATGNRISVKDIIACIEKGGIFKINSKKTKLNHLRHKSHNITGMSIHAQCDSQGIEDAWITLPKKKQKFYRGRIMRVVRFLHEGCNPNVAEHGVSINQIEGYITWIRHVCNEHIPSSLKKIIIIFENLTKDKKS